MAIQAPIADPDSLLIRPVTLPTPSRADVARRLSVATRGVARRLPAALRDSRGNGTRGAAVASLLRGAFEDLGGTFSKFGQLVGSAPSLFGDDVAHEFRSFLDRGLPVPYQAVAATIETELGQPIDQLFASFDHQPVAAASLAVVHRATLPDGTTVAVKVLRPGIEQDIATDLALLAPLSTFIARQLAVGIASTLPGLIAGLRDQVSEELDLTNEARSMRWFTALRDAMGLTTIVVPEPFESLSSRRVLTMEFIEGVAIDDPESITALGVDAATLVRDTITAWLATALCTGRFHGDIHAGNLLVTPDGRLGVVDWGIVGRLDEASHQFFRRCIEGVLGDESAWMEVAFHIDRVYGEGLREALGLSDEQMVAFVRAQVEPIFHQPFGQVDLTTMIGSAGENSTQSIAAGPTPRTRREQLAFWRQERARVRRLMANPGYGSDFDRATFLLSKQLVYFDRYGKQYLPETPLMHDSEAYRAILALPLR